MKWETVSGQQNELGEGPVWDIAARCIIWTDIYKGQIHQYNPAEHTHKLFKVGQKTSAVALKRSGGFIAALEHGFATIDTEKQDVSMIIDPESHLPGNRFNDGKCDPAGRFWAGTMAVSGEGNTGSLYALDKTLTVSVKINAIGCSNGMAWSNDQTVFYFIDTPTRQVSAYDYTIDNGSISNKRVIITMDAKDGLPDGMTIDTEGMLWIAVWGGWKVERWDPVTGKLLHRILLPVSQVSSCTFGGSALNDLYITSARHGLSGLELQEQPLAGSLFVIKNCGYYGSPAAIFEDM
ncbi:MAG TPA: SMP-30/gluconolactonase/LRE family protein [Chitinophagaceae bacterium]|nr:SMP-30/gluconolactonase/LRE family protein [Chitinophagaceae bacterium]